MKTTIKSIGLFFITSLTIISCGEQDPKDRLKELKNQKIAIQEEIDSLEIVVHGGGNEDANLVSFSSLEKKDFQNFFMVQGITEAKKEVLLNSETSGLITKIYVEEGQKVSQGQTLMLLDAELIAKNIQEVEKSLELAEFVYEKQKNLHDQNIGSELQFQQAKNNKERLEETLKTLKAQQGKSVLSAPFSGYVDQIFMHEGEMAMPQMPLIRLMDLSGMTFKADVMENYLKDVKPTTKVNLRIAALDTVIESVPVSRIGKFINPTNRSFLVEAKITNTNERILPNLVADIQINHEVIKDAFVIPTEALLQSSSGQNFIYVAKEEAIKSGDKEVTRLVAQKLIVERVVSNREEPKMSVIRDMPGQNDLQVGMKLIVKGARGVKNGMVVIDKGMKSEMDQKKKLAEKEEK